MNPNQTDKINGTVNKTVEKGKQVVGNVFQDADLKKDGKTQGIKGDAQKAKGAMKDAIKDGLHKAGDLLERAGEKLEEKGFRKVGGALGRAGDKVEHLVDEKN